MQTMRSGFKRLLCGLTIGPFVAGSARAEEFYALAGAAERSSGIVPAAFAAGAVYAAALRTTPSGWFGPYARPLRALSIAGGLYITAAAVNAVGFPERLAEGCAVAAAAALGEFGLRFLHAAAAAARAAEGEGSDPRRRQRRLNALTAWQALQWITAAAWVLGLLIQPAAAASLFIIGQAAYAALGAAIALYLRAQRVAAAEKIAVAWVPAVAGGAAAALTYIDGRLWLLPAVAAGAAAVGYYAHLLRTPADALNDHEVRRHPVIGVTSLKTSKPPVAAPVSVPVVTSPAPAQAPWMLLHLREGSCTVSPAAAQMLLLPASGLYRNAGDWLAAVPPSDAAAVIEALQGFASPSCLTPQVDFRLADPDLGTVFRYYRLQGLRSSADSADLLLGLYDLTDERAAHEADLRRAADDPVSGLPGRRAFFERAHEAARRFRGGTLVLYRLGEAADIYRIGGRRCGDFVLRRLASRLIEHAAADDVIGRPADDILAVFYAAPSVDILRAAERSLKRSVGYGSREIFVSVRVKTAVLPEDPALYDPGVWMRDVFEPVEMAGADDDGVQPDPLTLPADALTALQEGRLQVFYQPIVRPLDGKIAGAEALLRWQHPRYGLLAPGAFRAAADAAGMMPLFSRFVLAAAAEKAAGWRRQLQERGDPRGETFFISVNVLREQPEETLAGDVSALIAAVPLPPGILKLEIAENAWPLSETAMTALHTCRKAGASLWLDDFGTETAGFRALLDLPLDGIKIDRSLVRAADDSGQARQLLRGILHMARDLGLDTVAEGVADPRMAERLSMMGCHYAQGRGFGMPMAEEAFAELLLPPVELRSAEAASVSVEEPEAVHA